MLFCMSLLLRLYAFLVQGICKYKQPGNLIASVIMSFSTFGYYGQIWFNRDYTYKCAVEEMPASYADTLMQCSPLWVLPVVIIIGILISIVIYRITEKQFHFETEGCAGWQDFGYNRKLPLCEILHRAGLSGTCTYFLQ